MRKRKEFREKGRSERHCSIENTFASFAIKTHLHLPLVFNLKRRISATIAGSGKLRNKYTPSVHSESLRTFCCSTIQVVENGVPWLFPDVVGHSNRTTYVLHNRGYNLRTSSS